MDLLVNNKNKDKIIGFRDDVSINKILDKHTFDHNITKKDWLKNNLEKDENQALLENKQDEKWVKIPASEYNHLIVNPEKHSGFACDRIVAHVGSQGKELTFDNLWFEIQTFQKLNDIECTRIKEGKSEVIFCKHDMGMNTSLFLCYLVLDMVNITPNYQFESKMITEKTFMIKIKLTNR